MIGYAGRARLLRGERHPLTLNAAATAPIGLPDTLPDASDAGHA
jgi:hypothetical protein